MLKKFVSLCVLVVMLVSCNSNTNSTAKDSTTTSIENLDIITSDSATAASPLAYIKSSAGKMATDINLWDDPIAGPRIEKLMQDRWSLMKKNWNTETPLELQGDVLHASGCKSHNCPADGYDLYIDLKNDVINVYNLANSTVTLYLEKAPKIALSGGLQTDMQNKMTNANIKDESAIRVVKNSL